MPAKNKEGRIFLLDRAKAQQTGTFWLSLFQEEKLVRDLVGGQDLSNPGGFAIDEGGSVATFNGAQQQNKAIVFPSGFGAGNIIVAARIKATAAQAANPGAAFGIAASAGTQTGIGVGFDASNNVGHAFLDSAAAGLRGYSAGALNTYYTVFAQRLSNTNAYGWINGNPATTSQGAAGGSFGTIDELVIGAQHRSAGYLRQFKGNIEWAALIYLPKAGTAGTDGLMSDEFAKYLYESNYPYSLEAKPSRIWVAGAGGGVTAALTGQAITASTGTIAAAVSAALTGQAITASTGTLTPSISAEITGQSAALSGGIVSPVVEAPLTGQDVPLGQGTVTVEATGDVTRALTGQALSIAQGNPTAVVSLALNGQSVVVSGGVLSSSVVAGINGQQASVAQGVLSAAITAPLTGQSAVLSNGTVAVGGSDVLRALTGQQLGISLGSVIQYKTVARPTSDASVGAWLPSSGSVLYDMLDEATADSADYIYATTATTCQIALNAVADPQTSSGQVVSYQAWSPNGDGLTARLKQGAVTIAAWTHSALPTSPTIYAQTLSAAECDAITNYSDLRIELESL